MGAAVVTELAECARCVGEAKQPGPVPRLLTVLRTCGRARNYL